MPIAATMAVEKGMSELRKDMKEMQEVIKQQAATIRRLESQQESKVDQSNLQASLLNKAETSEMKRLFSKMQQEIEHLKKMRDNREKFAEALKRTVKIDQFAMLEKRLVDLHSVMDSTASQLFDRYATSMEATLSSKADVGMVQTALKTKASQMEVKELTADLHHLRSKLGDLQQQQKVLPSVIGEVVLSKLGPELVSLQTARSDTDEHMKSVEKNISELQKTILKVRSTVTGGSGGNGVQSIDERILCIEKQQAGVLSQLKASQHKNKILEDEQSQVFKELQHTRAAQHEGMAALKHQRVAVADVQKQTVRKTSFIAQRVDTQDGMQEHLQKILNERTAILRSEIAALVRDRDRVEQALAEQRQESKKLRLQGERNSKEVEDVRGPLMDQIMNLKEESRAIMSELQRQQHMNRQQFAVLSNPSSTNNLVGGRHGIRSKKHSSGGGWTGSSRKIVVNRGSGRYGRGPQPPRSAVSSAISSARSNNQGDSVSGTAWEEGSVSARPGSSLMLHLQEEGEEMLVLPTNNGDAVPQEEEWWREGGLENEQAAPKDPQEAT